MRLLAFVSLHIIAAFNSAAFNMKCEYVASGWYSIGNVKNCYAKNLTIEKPEFVESVNGETKILEDVIGFWVENEVCHYIPQKMVDFLPKLKAFGISNSGLRTISKFDIAPFPEIVRLALYGNKLEYIDRDLFEFNAKIQSLSLEDNHLLIINGPILKPLKNLNQITVKLTCLSTRCDYSSCIPETFREFSEKCEFDSVYPGFTKYFNGIKSISETCNLA